MSSKNILVNTLLHALDGDNKTAVHATREVKKEQSIAQIRPYKGHTLFEVDITNETITVIRPEKTAIMSANSVDTHNKVETKPNCLYISCLNRKNLKRLIDNAGGKDISGYKFIK